MRLNKRTATGIKCPFGKTGDRLWIRETHADISCRLTFRADPYDGAHCQVKKWTPAIHMFRRHSRVLLEITDVRVERLQDISEEQAVDEGLLWEGEENGKTFYTHIRRSYSPASHR